MEGFIALFIGLGLSVSCGMRVFLPLFATSLFSKLGYIDLTGKFSWLESNLTLYALGTATLIEVIAYLIPWIDTFLKALATPLAIMAGILITSSTLPLDDGLIKWGLAIVAGGGAAGSSQLVSTGTRGVVNSFSAGVGGIFFTVIETVFAAITTLLSILAPIIMMLILLGLTFVIIKYRQKLWNALTNNKLVILMRKTFGKKDVSTELT